MVVERASRAELERTFHELVFKLKLDLELTRTIYHGIGLLEIEICKELFYKIESTLDFVILFISIFIIINQFYSLQNVLKLGSCINRIPRN
jgi:hypothetical protein